MERGSNRSLAMYSEFAYENAIAISRDTVSLCTTYSGHRSFVYFVSVMIINTKLFPGSLNLFGNEFTIREFHCS